MSDWELRVSQKDVHRMHVVRLTLEGRETVGRAAKRLGISPRQMKRLRRKMKERGVEGLLHGNRGKAAWNKTVTEKIKQILEQMNGSAQCSFKTFPAARSIAAWQPACMKWPNNRAWVKSFPMSCFCRT